MNAIDCFSYDRPFMKIFSTFDVTTVRLCQYYLGILPLDYQLDLRKLTFLMRMKKDSGLIDTGLNLIFAQENLTNRYSNSLRAKYVLNYVYSFTITSKKCINVLKAFCAIMDRLFRIVFT